MTNIYAKPVMIKIITYITLNVLNILKKEIYTIYKDVIFISPKENVYSAIKDIIENISTVKEFKIKLITVKHMLIVKIVNIVNKDTF